MKKLLIISIILFSISSVSAQFGNQGGMGGGMGGMGGGGFGGNNGMGSQMGQPVNEPDKPKEIPAEVTAKKVVDNIKVKLQLDELQVIAIEGIVTKSIKAQGVIIKKGDSDEQKIEDIKALSENTDRKIMELLNKTQKENYKAMIEEKTR